MYKIKKFTHLKFIICTLSLWALYTFFYAYFKTHSFDSISGYFSFFGETLLDLTIILLSYFSLKKSVNEFKVFFILFCISFSFAFISDTTYNLYLNVLRFKITPLGDSLFDIPFIFFLLFQAIAWSYLFLKSNKPKSNKHSQYVLYWLAAIFIFFTFIFGITWRMHYFSIVGTYQIIDTLLESIGFLFVSFCLIRANQLWIKLLTIGYLIIIASDFMIRYLVVEKLNFAFNPMETTWVLGLLTINLALFFGMQNNYKNVLIDVSSIKVKTSIFLFVSFVVAIFLFLLLSFMFSGFDEKFFSI